MLDLVRSSRIPLTDQIVDGLTAMIVRRQLAEGTRLPSVRRLSRELGVSAFTVVTAYDRLAAAGTIEPRAGTPAGPPIPASPASRRRRRRPIRP
jgi:DNA-binding transcriptional regulator YhcF (GntR family)